MDPLVLRTSDFSTHLPENKGPEGTGSHQHRMRMDGWYVDRIHFFIGLSSLANNHG